jgi:hypothetical protein
VGGTGVVPRCQRRGNQFEHRHAYFQVSSRNTGLAVQLTNAYANGFIAFRRYLDTEAVLAAEADVRARLTQSSPHTSLYGSLVSRLDQLQTLDALQTSNAELVASATLCA